MVELWSRIKKIFHNTILYFIASLMLVSISHTQSSIQGKVVGVADGDTITVLQNSKQYKIRLHGVDTPEKKQNFGMKAKKFTSNMVFQKKVKIVSYGTGKYGRTIGIVYIGQKCLNEELVKNGFAWVYKKYCSEPFCNDWLQLEKEARENKLGLWIDDDPVPPWKYRHGTNKKRPTNYSGPYHGNVSSHIFHAPWCKHFNCNDCTEILQDKKSAINSGYRPCGFCKP